MEPLPRLMQPIVKGRRSKHFPRGQIIFYEGDSPDEVYVLTAGVIKIYDIDESGNEKILHLVKSPAVVPLAFFSGGKYSLTWFYGALNDCDVSVLDKADLQAKMLANPKLAMYLINRFSTEVHELLVRLSSLGKTNARDKLIAALKFLGKYHTVIRRSGWRRVNFSVNQQLLADMTGLTRESAAMIMRDLQLEGIVRHPKLTILEINFAKLIELPPGSGS